MPAPLKRAFKQERVLARKGETLEAHRVLAHHEFVDGFYADLILYSDSAYLF